MSASSCWVTWGIPTQLRRRFPPASFRMRDSARVSIGPNWPRGGLAGGGGRAGAGAWESTGRGLLGGGVWAGGGGGRGGAGAGGATRWGAGEGAFAPAPPRAASSNRIGLPWETLSPV